MAWIASNQELGEHPKTKRLAKLLDISRVTAVGHLHFLWWWALDYAQDGDLSKFDELDIAEAVGWEGNPGDFIEALLTCGPGGRGAGFLERDEDGALLIHDWWEYAGKLVGQRKANAARMRKSRETKKERAKNVQNTNIAREGATQHTQHNTTEPIINNNNNNAREEVVEPEIPSEPTLPAPDDDLSLELEGLPSEGRKMDIGTQAVRWAEEKWGRMLSPREADQIFAWCDEFSSRGSPEPDAVVIAGLSQCDDAGPEARNMNYLKRVMTSWREAGVITVKQAELRKIEWEKNKEKRGSKHPREPNPPKVPTGKYNDFYLS
ncbi:DnaD domain protein [Desulfitobacterium hafniense]|uniref:DnaB/C C-terminal domain-containing protein n=1 Tax=Desulfitobacterium hafniense (strain Y51) TaxID=138119 RepID=Q24VF4_DESHY|nr:DnaD domain protein [Desulfitobacterium hafniense]BAE83988.1 hypothetical protein DSY2199 [Desulfitobacterium hafniense Y51]